MSFEKALDQGYVRLVNHMGSDLTVANAARVSYAKESVKHSQQEIQAYPKAVLSLSEPHES